MKISLDKVLSLKIAAVAVSCSLLWVIGYFLFLGSSWKWVSEANQQENTLKLIFTTKFEEKKNAQKMKEELTLLKDKDSFLVNEITGFKAPEKTLSELILLAESLSLSFENLKPSHEKGLYELALSGPYTSLMEFLSQFIKKAIPIEIKKMQIISSSKNSGPIQMEITIGFFNTN